MCSWFFCFQAADSSGCHTFNVDLAELSLSAFGGNAFVIRAEVQDAATSESSLLDDDPVPFKKNQFQLWVLVLMSQLVSIPNNPLV